MSAHQVQQCTYSPTRTEELTAPGRHPIWPRTDMTLTDGGRKAVGTIDVCVLYEMGTYSTMFNVLCRSMGWPAAR